MMDFFSLLVLIKLVSYAASQITLDQPGSAVVNPSGTLKLSCKVSVTVTSQHWVWIWQAPGKGLEYVGYLDSGTSSYPAPTYKSRVTFTGDNSKNEISLQMTSMKNEDSGTYYCARYTLTEGSEN
ncbi:hypothetical protein XELAEV_18007082mg [Xenopus laevis]|uniref:Ig-like domain-containing protein n=1 Tax=Xenopus laevis TaxID=8355 RepID=A0A974E1M5_XENLA|nr:hypothetical protein XELAEV_18007082mg [Xenopus laevis]